MSWSSISHVTGIDPPNPGLARAENAAAVVAPWPFRRFARDRHNHVEPFATAPTYRSVASTFEFHLVADAGHSYNEPGILDRLVRATDDFADR